MPTNRTFASVLRAAALAGTLSGAPSTAAALLRRQDPLASTRAAGTLLLPDDDRAWRLVLVGAAAHAGLSLGWAAVLAAVLPRRHPAAWGAVAGLAIAALDLDVVGRRRPAIRVLPRVAQHVDHVAFGAVAGWALGRR